ncbi:DUF2563 family protein [Mycobacterium simiae]|uniref:DUF2563 family protein n=1 Tax=Mycobacterium simiae TaxID=1784 RepID=A0A1X0XIA6_MYCSI|nr:DUF2563 family protein [Mycobacterium simiae]ORJ52603.1 hypothetical protein B5M45_30925 [Mycobacterium simiae]
MFVDPGSLHAGGNQSHRAGGHAQKAADQLSRGPLLSGMFGEFPTAGEFHNAIGAGQAKHVQSLRVHHVALTAIGSKAHGAASEFSDMDERNAAKLRAVRCSSAT